MRDPLGETRFSATLALLVAPVSALSFAGRQQPGAGYQSTSLPPQGIGDLSKESILYHLFSPTA